MSTAELQIKARIHLLSPQEGGRATPVVGGVSYRPNHNFFGPNDRQMCMGAIEIPEGQELAPGDTRDITLTLWARSELAATISKGRTWRIQEGAKFVGTGTVLEVLHRSASA